MFKLHIYNPEHDIVLGKNDVSFTPPRAARLTRERYCHIPAFWAEDGDWILVDDVQRAQDNLKSNEGLPQGFNSIAKVKFVTFDDLKGLKNDQLPSEILPWGWDKHIVHRLLKCNPLFRNLVPDSERLDAIRRFSSREFASEKVLPEIISKSEAFVGQARSFSGTVEDLQEIVKNNGSIVLKSPWSCSGRGVKFIESELSESEKGWVRNVLEEQGAIMIEPLYNKVLDFAMEFVAEKSSTRFVGLNVFTTNNGAYLQNFNDSEEGKLAKISEYIDAKLLDIVKDVIIDITTNAFRGIYEGPFGVDMMIVRDAENKTKVHPCVEMNLRRTMGQIGLI